MIVLDVPGEPKPQARPRAYRVGEGIRVHSPKEAWHERVYWAGIEAAREHGSLSGPTRVVMEFRLRRVSGVPKTREIPHVKKPDLDNVIKGTLDSLVPALLATDQQVVELVARKRYALAGEAPGCRIELTAAEAATE